MYCCCVDVTQECGIHLAKRGFPALTKLGRRMYCSMHPSVTPDGQPYRANWVATVGIKLHAGRRSVRSVLSSVLQLQAVRWERG